MKTRNPYRLHNEGRNKADQTPLKNKTTTVSEPDWQYILERSPEAKVDYVLSSLFHSFIKHLHANPNPDAVDAILTRFSDPAAFGATGPERRGADRSTQAATRRTGQSAPKNPFRGATKLDPSQGF